MAAGAPAPKAGVLRLRILSALVLAPVALAAVWFGSPFLPVLVALAAIGMGWEWARLSGADSPLVKAAVIATGLASVTSSALGAPVTAIVIALIGALGAWSAAAASRARAPLWTAAGTLWFVIPCITILWIAPSPDGRASVFWVLAVVWVSDTGAYAAGKALGGPRLAPRLSPNKTWAGAMGGLAGAGLIGVAAAYVMAAPLAPVLGASLILAVAAQLGDLLESFAKRHFGSKDSGGLIPGHGGLLDRLDSLLAAATVLGLMTWLGGGTPLGWRL